MRVSFNRVVGTSLLVGWAAASIPSIEIKDWNHRAMEKIEVDLTFDQFLFESATNSAALTEASSPDAIPHSRSHTQGEKLRYHVALRTPTAMVKSVEEIPILYLNKGQVYGTIVMDLNPPAIPLEVFRY
ncbi:CP2 transcription factor [Penicillium angulare]|uniref:CP2 transcription factor n=1 Tax=Penicillium angulare TaxID=116970 RepID=UPI00253FAEF2|nr:CP2 transcription factor [Penicillium angulare]KAJ5288252.1 CP2 transcription factor [Penicillium angulare]